jgi:hypothetical protein
MPSLRSSSLIATAVCLCLPHAGAPAQGCGLSAVPIGAVALGSAVRDIWTAPSSARKYNLAHVAQRGSDGIPTVAPRAKSPVGAATFSFAATAAPIVLAALASSDTHAKLSGPLIAVGVGVGPAAGHFYAHQTRRAFTGIGLRVLLAGAAIAMVTKCGPD